ncbi:MAG: polysaccharide biosynthesis tyrosine autokinase [Crocinitomicaceae bacterium]|nr:polysaccharide biosynthesis tyrosine autokinase [Crocinitomicaceae bacterium]
MGKQKDIHNHFQDEINLRDLLNRYLAKWKWFALALTIAFVGTFFMLRYTPKKYESKAKLLIKFEQSGSYSELSAFQDLGMFDGMGGYNNLYNEMEILQSRPLIEQVIRELKLNIQYFLVGSKTGIERNEFYKNSPLEIQLLKADSSDNLSGAVFTVEILNHKEFKFVDSETFKSVTYNFGDTLEFDELGKFTLSTTKYYFAKNENTRISISVRSLESSVSIYQTKLNVEVLDEHMDILSLSVRGAVIKQNNEFLNALIAEHNNQTIDDQKNIYRNTTLFINDRIEHLSDELTDVEMQDEEYKSRFDFSDVFLSEKSLYDRILINEKKLVDAEIQSQLVNFLYDYLISNPENNSLLPTNLGFDDNSIVEATVQYNKTVLEKKRVLNHSSEQNPEVIKFENDLVNIKASLKLSLENYKYALEIKVNELRSMEESLNINISSLPTHKRVLRSMDRQQQVKEALYIYLLQKREENEIASAVTEGNSKVIEYAFSNGVPVSPREKTNYAIALLLGLIVPFGFFYLKSALDNKVQGKADLDAHGLPHLATIPKIDGNKKIVISKGNTSPEAEAFRILRTNASFILGPDTGKGKTIITTSTIAKEGKSFVALNLATSYALSGKKTIVVGLDLRAPKLLEYSDLPDSIGVTNYLLDQSIDLNSMIINSPTTENLFILPSGLNPPNPAELLMRDELKNLITTLEESYDIVIIDSAPIGLVTDTLLISEMADAFIYVVRANYLEKKLLSVPDQLRNEGKIKNIGIVINAVNFKKSIGYGYGYGYGNIKVEKPWYKRLFSK